MQAGLRHSTFVVSKTPGHVTQNVDPRREKSNSLREKAAHICQPPTTETPTTGTFLENSCKPKPLKRLKVNKSLKAARSQALRKSPTVFNSC
jgi:hypothetical protein